MNFEKGNALVAVLVGVLILVGTVAVAYYFSKKASFEYGTGEFKPVEPPNAKPTFQKSFNLISLMASEKDIKAVKELRANMVTFFYAAALGRENEFPKARLAYLISVAHKNGLQVEIRNSFAAEGDPITDLNAYKKRMVDFASDLAKFAQENKVYRLAPFSEIDNNLFKHEEEVNQVARDILVEVRKYYKGQIGIGIAAPWREAGYKFEGFDYMSISIYPKKQDSLDEYFQGSSFVSLGAVLSVARKVAQRSGIDTLIIGETGVFNPGEEKFTAFQTKILSKEEEAQYYRKFFEATSGKVQGYSPVYFGYMAVKDDPAEEVVKEWYKKL